MKRAIEQWENCNPHAMATNQSNAAIEFAFADAKADILSLHDALKQVSDFLDKDARNIICSSSLLHKIVQRALEHKGG